MVRNKLAAAILSAGLLMPVVSSALGVGDYTLKSYLNQPLELEIDLIQAKDLSVEEIVASLASSEEFTNAGLERNFLLQDIRFEIQQKSDGHFVIVARSSRPINEPFLDFLIAVQWPQGRILREYTVLLDPPVYKSGAPATATEAPVVSEQPPAPAPAPVTAPEPAVVSQPAPMDFSSLPPPPSERSSDRAPSYRAPAAAPAAQAPGGEYTVRGGDTMMEIARQHRGGATVQQTMIAIQRANSGAFINGNINLVKKGVVLRIPDEAEIQQVSTSEANNAVASQNRAWRELLDSRGIAVAAGKAQLEAGGAAPAKPAAKKGAGTGEVTLVAPTASGKGAAAGSGKQAEALKSQLAIAEEGLDKAARENKELASRLGDLDSQVKKSEKVLKLKDDQIAGLQKELDTLRKAKGAAPAKEAAKAGEPVAEGAKPAPTEKPAEAPKPVAKAPAKPKKAPEAEPQPPAPEQGSSLLMPIVGVLALLGIGGGAFWWMRRKKAATGTTAAVALETTDHEEQIAEDLAQLQGLGGGEEHAEAPAAGGESEGGDPLGEADMYMAYGRFQQAADILYAALQREPERDDIRVKLAEVYAEMGDESAAREQASKLAESGNAAIRAQAQAVLAKVGGGAAAAPAARAAESEPSLDDLALEFSGGKAEPQAEAQKEELSFDLGGEDFAFEEPSAATPAPEPAAESLEFSLDDVDFDAGSKTEVHAALPAEELSLEDTGFGEFTLEEEAPAAAAPAPAMGLEEELTLEEAVAAEEPALEDSFDFAATTGAQPKLPAAAVEEVAAPVAEAAGLDLESELADLEADLTAEGVQAPAAAGDDFDFLSDSDENATKLDLAKAYIDMGDAEGARDILNEVVADGNATQKAEAQKLLAQVG